MNKKAVLSFICAVIVAALLSSCSGQSAVTPETSALTRSESTTEKEEKKTDDFTLTVYTDPESDEFKATGDIFTELEGCEEAKEGELIRVICSEDGVDLVLEAVSYSDALGVFYPISPIFMTSSNGGTVYQFAAPIADAIPKYRLSATHGDAHVEWALIHDGEDDISVLELNTEKDEPTPPEEDSAIVTLCKVFANKTLETGCDIEYAAELYWSTVAQSVMENEYRLNGVMPAKAKGYEQWVIDSCAEALFPGENAPGIGNNESIYFTSDFDEIDSLKNEYVSDYDGIYVISPDFEPINSMEFVSSEITSEENATVTFEADSDEGVITVDVYLDFDDDCDNPFGWSIGGCEIYD